MKPGMVSCSFCPTRRRSVVLWYLPRHRGAPVPHVGLPTGWALRLGRPACPRCYVTFPTRFARRNR